MRQGDVSEGLSFSRRREAIIETGTPFLGGFLKIRNGRKLFDGKGALIKRDVLRRFWGEATKD